MASSKLQENDAILSVQSQTKEMFISDEFLNVYETTFSVPLHGAISIFGVVSNAFSVVIFFTLGLKDSMTVALFALSLTDLFNSILQMSITVCYLAADFFLESPVDLWSLAYVSLGWAFYVGYLITDWITTLIAVERCVCVVAPFKVQRLFTRKRCVIIIIAIYLIHCASVLPIYLVQKWEWLPRNVENNSYSVDVTLVFTAVFDGAIGQAELITDIVEGIFLSLISLLLLIICTVWMAYSLNVSSKRRSKLLCHQFSASQAGPNKAMKTPLKNHEERLIKVALFLSVSLTVCNMPRLAVGLFHHTYPGISNGALLNLNRVLWSIADLFMCVCCSLNPLGYFVLNSSYRKTFYKYFQL